MVANCADVPGRPAGGEVAVGFVPVLVAAEIGAHRLHVFVGDLSEEGVAAVQPRRKRIPPP